MTADPREREARRGASELSDRIAQRREREARRRRRETYADDWLTQVFYYGFGQVFLCVPALWLVYLSPVGAVRTAGAVALAATPLVIGTLRGGWVGVRRPWPALSNDKLGVGGGYREFAGRSAYLSATFGLVAATAAAVGAVVDSTLAVGATSALVTAASLAAVPYAFEPTTRARWGRAGFYAVGFGAIVAVTVPFAPVARSPTAICAFALLVAAAAFDLR